MRLKDWKKDKKARAALEDLFESVNFIDSLREFDRDDLVMLPPKPIKPVSKGNATDRQVVLDNVPLMPTPPKKQRNRSVSQDPWQDGTDILLRAASQVILESVDNEDDNVSVGGDVISISSQSQSDSPATIQAREASHESLSTRTRHSSHTVSQSSRQATPLGSSDRYSSQAFSDEQGEIKPEVSCFSLARDEVDRSTDRRELTQDIGRMTRLAEKRRLLRDQAQ